MDYAEQKELIFPPSPFDERKNFPPQNTKKYQPTLRTCSPEQTLPHTE